MSQSLSDYIATKTNTAVKSRNGISGQCVSIPSLFFENNGLPPLAGASAYSIWLYFRNPSYDVILYGPNMQGQPGDAVFFAPNDKSLGTGQYGHIDLFVSGDIHGKWIGFDQDWNTGDGNMLAKQVPHNSNGVLGVMRPKGITTMPTPLNERTVTADDLNRLLPSLFPGELNNPDASGFMGQAFHDFVYNVVADPRYVANVATLMAVKAGNTAPHSVVIDGVTYVKQV